MIAKQMDISATAHNYITSLDSLDLEFGLSRREYYAVWGLLNSALHDTYRDEATKERWVTMAGEMLAETTAALAAKRDAEAEAHAMEVLRSMH